MLLAVLLAAAMVALMLRFATPETPSRPLAQPVSASTQRFDFTPEQKAELSALTDTPAKAAVFQSNLEKAFAGYGVKIGTGQMPMTTAPEATKGAEVTVRNANYSGSSLTIEEILAQGWDRDHWWLTMSYADAAYGGIGAATAGCMVYLPWFVCAPLGAILGSWVAGYSKASNHGVWAAVYRSGYITGGRW